MGQIKGILSVDQVAQVVGDGILYVHADKNNDKTGAFMANILKYNNPIDFALATL
jgi:hypothetical protein